MMRLTAVCAMLLSPLAFAQPSTSKDAKIDQMFKAMNIEAQQKQMLAQMQQMVISQVKAQLPSEADKAKAEEMEKKMFALIEQETSWQKLKPVMVKACSDTYTEPEIDGILAFYKSPAGQAMINKQPTLISKVMTGMQSQMTNIMSEVEKLMRQQ